MHASQGNAGVDGNLSGGITLLRFGVTSKAESHKLCLQCHASNGALAAISHAPQNVAAPKVYSSGTWNDDTAFNQIGAGGNFSTELDSSWGATTPASLGYGHSIGAASVTPPGGDQSVSTLTCTSCHDPHGTSSIFNTDINIFRNLKVKAQDAGAHSGVKLCPDGNTALCSGEWSYRNLKSYTGGVNGAYFGGSETDNAAQVIWPVYRNTLAGVPATDAPNSNAYGADDIYGADSSGKSFSHWCGQCHDNFHVNLTGYDIDWQPTFKIFNNANPFEYEWGNWSWLRHPTNVVMPRKAGANCAGTCHPSKLDRTNYSLSLIQAGKGIPVTASRFYGVSGAYDTVYYLPYEPPPAAMDGLVSASGNTRVFCLSCHFAHGGPHYDALRWNYTSIVSAGSQSGNTVPSNKGCQLCHNIGS
ncbi:MAG: hypothetical protein WA162_08710 [Thermodesulfobacteriota bacterium]